MFVVDVHTHIHTNTNTHEGGWERGGRETNTHICKGIHIYTHTCNRGHHSEFVGGE